MVTLHEYDNLLIPGYALTAIVYGDTSGIEESDEKAIDNYMGYYYDKAEKLGGFVIFSPEDDVQEFCHCPEFGSPCDCVRCTIIIAK